MSYGLNKRDTRVEYAKRNHETITRSKLPETIGRRCHHRFCCRLCRIFSVSVVPDFRDTIADDEEVEDEDAADGCSAAEV